MNASDISVQLLDARVRPVSRATYIAEGTDAFRMTEFERQRQSARRFGRGYARGHFQRAFVGVSVEEIRKVGGAR